MFRFIFILVLMLPAFVTFAQEGAHKLYESNDLYITKGKGFEFHFFNDAYLMEIDFRGQFRATTTFGKYYFENDEVSQSESTLGINRARIKIGGHIAKSYYTYYFEQDILGGNLLDFRVQIEKLPYLQLRVGQWKARYSRERVISSGSQQGLDRSIINSIFTIDRQQGISLYGNLAGKGAANFSYWASVFTGMGRGSSTNDDNIPMYMMRWQWNPNGKELAFSGSDLKFHEKFTSSVALAGVTNTSPYTAFSTSGGGELFGFEPGEKGQYQVDQLMFETAFKYRGFSWQQELHYKNIDDRVNETETLLVGNYVQFGYFLHYVWEEVPKPLEFFVRHSFYIADYHSNHNRNSEYTFGCNWFFKGHKNKLTLEYSYLDYDQLNPDVASGNRIGLQWDISVF